MKKGRHRRFEEARKLKQAGPSASDLGFAPQKSSSNKDDEYAEIAERYGVTFDDDDDDFGDEIDDSADSESDPD